MKIRTKIFFVIVLIFSAIISVANTSVPFSFDTLRLTNKTGEIIPEKDVEDLEKLLESKDAKDAKQIANYFYNTGFALANKKDATLNDFRIAQNYFELAFSFYSKTESHKELALCLEHKATIEYELSNYKKAVTCFQQAIAKYEKEDSVDNNQIALLNNNIGFIFLNSYRFEKALRFFDIGLSIYKDLKDTVNIAKNTYQKGFTYFEAENYNSALAYYKQALILDSLTKKPNEIIASYNNISVTLIKLQRYNEAYKNLLSAADLIDSTSNKEAFSINKNNIGNIFFHSGKYHKALTFYLNSLDIKKTINNAESEAITLHNIAHTYSKINSTDEGISYINQALKLTESKTTNKMYGKICLTASKLYEQKGDFKTAENYYNLFIKNTYSILAEESNQISETQTKHKKEQRFKAASIQREIKMQELFAAYEFNIKSNRLKALEQERKSQQTTIYIFIAIIIFIVLGFVLLFNQYLIKKRASKKLAIQNEQIEKQNVIISEQSNILAESNKELEKLSVVASNTDNAILIMDSDGNFEWVNTAFTKLFGFSLEEFTNTISSNIINENTPDYIKTEVEKCKSNLVTVNYDFEYSNKAGEKIWTNVTLTPILDKDGNIERLVMIYADITALKNAEQKIREQKEEIEQQKEELTVQRDEVISQNKKIEQQKEKLANTLAELQATQNKLVESKKMASLGSLVAGISHEINTPIGVGTAASSTLLTKTKEITELFNTKTMKVSDLEEFLSNAQDACDLILKNLRRTADLIKSFNKVSVDNMSEEKREFNLRDYLYDITRSLSPKLKNRPITLEINCPDSINLMSYPGAFAQIFTNLIVNSLIHGFDELDKGEININITEQNETITLEYFDSGKGIPKENQDKIFDAFFTTNKKIGSGLGMNIMYNLVTQKLRGKITLKSEKDKGVNFTIILPKNEITA